MFRSDPIRLETTLRSLARAIVRAREAGVLGATSVWLIDNGNELALLARGQNAFAHAGVRLELRHGHGNVGYGRGHNIALLAETAEFRLVLNPDVELEENALAHAIAFLREHPRVGLLAPDVRNEKGEREYLCKRYPALADLLLRGFAPAWLRRRFAPRLAQYEMRDLIGDDVVEGIPIASGAFMLVRGEAALRTGGFDPQFFLYFEDFDWSLRLGAIMTNAYVPSVRIVHHGGQAARKGPDHIAMFVAGALRFYRKHGWRLR